MIAQLGLVCLEDARIERLSGGQRKRASVAMELLTEPSLLILDEPTSGLDPALDRQVMRSLRSLADGDRTVVVVTHSVANLDLCDQVLVLAPGGLQAYIGPRHGIAAHFGTDDWCEVFATVVERPEAARARWAAGPGPEAAASAPRVGIAPTRVGGEALSARTAAGPGRLRQFRTIIARQIDLILADRGYSAFLLALPFVLGALPVAVPGVHGLATASAVPIEQANEPRTILALLIIGAMFMGVAMSIRDLVGERSIWLRERAAGLRPSAYLLAKLTVLGVMSALAAGIMTVVAITVKPGPDTSVLGGWPSAVELYVVLAVSTFTAAALGLAISAFVASTTQVMPILILVLMLQLVLNGGLISLAGNGALDAVSRFVPGRWGFAAAASGIDLPSLLAARRPAGLGSMQDDALWNSDTAQWAFDMVMLGLSAAAYVVLAWLGLRRTAR